jgi:iron complex transport system ATP-binding protein
MLSAQNISMEYQKGQWVLKDLNFVLAAGEILTILGPNGSGKTTLLRCLNAILRPVCGRVVVEGADVFRMNTREIARRIGYVPQRNDAGHITVFDAVLLGRVSHMGWQAGRDDLGRVDGVLCQLGLESLALRTIDELSGGELQKVCIGRALVQDPKVLLLDEPTSSLDLKNQINILDLIRRVAAEHRMIVVAAMHDLNLALRLMDRFIFIKEGRIVAAGGAGQMDAAMVNEVYGVPVEILRHRGTPTVVPL